MPDSPNLAKIVEFLLSEFLGRCSPDPLGLRNLAADLHALPLHHGWFRALAVRPNGEIISFDIDGIQRPGSIRIETDSIIRNLTLYQGSKKYAELRDFVPEKLPDAIECPYCGGLGEYPDPSAKVVCYCGGLGWLPNTKDTGCFDR